MKTTEAKQIPYAELLEDLKEANKLNSELLIKIADQNITITGLRQIINNIYKEAYEDIKEAKELADKLISENSKQKDYKIELEE